MIGAALSAPAEDAIFAESILKKTMCISQT